MPTRQEGVSTEAPYERPYCQASPGPAASGQSRDDCRSDRPPFSAARTHLRARKGGSQARGVDVHGWRGNGEAPVAFQECAGADDR